MTKKRPPKSAPKSEPSYNGWHVLTRFIDGIFDLLNGNKIYPAFGVILLAIVAMVVWRLPASDLASILRILIEKFATGWGVLATLLFGTNLVWYLLLRKTRTIYINEITRLTELRQQLIHGGTLIKVHRSSNDAQNETYILPSNVVK